MMIQAVAFYVFAGIIIASAIMVVSAKNPVHSVLFLILAFFNGAGLFVLVGAEFLAMIMVIVYVGAVAVLFMFVVMMLDINFVELRQGFLQYLPIGLLVGLILLVELILILSTQFKEPQILAVSSLPIPPIEDVENTKALGNVLYTKYIYLFQSGGLILLTAMIGAIVLTLRSRPGVKKQIITKQVLRKREDSVEIKKVTPGTGV
ncbi:MAG: NADH:ubiquinone oxidoreductase subunit J [Rhodospirillaceae bacterium]|nr:NADH:ubiquinone oxidoreductase subunit J [Rhodospirillaceae bacterium]|tara:strand:- start:639 stop:1253 length:615 start_codon:yes stop_codon:yes gene_type:complete